MTDTYEASEPAGEEKTEKKKKARMSEADFQTLVTTGCEDAVNYVEGNISVDRATATDYYNGKLPDVDGDALAEDRSTAVLTDVRDTVLGMMPDMLRIFFSTESICTYTAVAKEDPELQKQAEEQARQATDYVHNIVLRQDNPDSFTTFRDAFEDAFVRKTGFIKYWWQKKREPKYSTHTGLDKESVLAILSSDDDVEILGKRAYPNPYLNESPMAPAVLYDIQIKRICDYGKIRLQAVPCENVFVSRRARSPDTSPVFGYSEEKSVSDFVDMGFDEDDLKDCDRDPDDTESVEKLARSTTQDVTPEEEPAQDPSQRKIKYTEVYVRADKDGDGIAELHRVVCAGTRFKVLKDEPYDDVCYAAFCPYPRAHEFFGDSVADLTMDTQRIGSRILRDTMDSLAQSVTPITTVVEGQVNLDDVLNPDTSPVIRQRAPGMVQWNNVPFAGREALPVLDFIKNVREGRTGQSDASQGLDPKVLQSTDKDAVHATLSKAQARIAMIAQIFAETGMKRLFTGILKLAIKHQTQSRMVKLRGKFVSVDPAAWDSEMVVEAAVAGRGSLQDQLGFLVQVAGKQEQLLQTLGPENPFVTVDHYSYTLRKIVEAGGFQNTGSFFTDTSQLSFEQKQQLVQAMQAAMKAAQGGGAAGPAAPNPEVEMAKIEANKAIKMAELDWEREKAAAEMQLEGAKLEADQHLRVFEVMATHKMTIDKAQIDAAVKHMQEIIKSRTAIAVERLKPRGGADKGASSNAGD